MACEFAKRTQALRPWFVCAQESGPAGRADWEGIPLERLAPRRVYTRFCKLGLAPPGRTLPARFLATCKEVAPALLHVHQLEFDLVELGRRYPHPPPVILHAHVLSQRPHSRRGVADGYIAVSDYVAAGLAQMGYPAERIVTIRNGVDTKLFAPPNACERAVAKKRLGVAIDTPVLAFVGRKHDVKGYPAFLAVAERLLTQDRPLLILSVGADPERPAGEGGFMASRDRQQRLIDDKRFRSLSAMSQRDLAQLYHAIDVTLLPSIAEPQGMVMIESLAAGCVTISSRVGGIGETIEHGVTGYLVDDPRDTDALYQRAVDVLDRLCDLAPMRALARSFALAHLDWTVSAERLDALYRKTIS
ncbi:MAG: glycosyltransferase family 4 protein [Acidiferrobacter sp.]